MVDERLFWSYVALWVSHNKYTWRELAKHCGMSVKTLSRKRGGGSALTVAQFNCICQGIGLMPEMVVMNNRHYASPFLAVPEELRQG